MANSFNFVDKNLNGVVCVGIWVLLIEAEKNPDIENQPIFKLMIQNFLIDLKNLCASFCGFFLTKANIYN